MRGALVGAAEESESLQTVDDRRREVVACPAFDLRLAEPGADPLGACRQGCRLAGESVRVDSEVDLAHTVEPTAEM
jgi:hypothetical protein